MTYVLLIEDDDTNAELITQMLETKGYHVERARQGLEGFKMARANKPTLILLDFNLPDMDGCNIIGVIRHQLGDVAAPPIVAMTGRSNAHDRRLAQNFGASAFLAKPFTPDVLFSVIDTALHA